MTPASASNRRTDRRSQQKKKSHGRVRSYLKESDGRDWDAESPSTPEGRLSHSMDDDWFVPDPRELKASSKYLQSDFEVKTEDEKGHDDRTWVRLSKQMLNEIRSIVDAHKFPIKNEQHLIRIAIFELILVLRKLEPHPGNHVALLKGINALAKDLSVIRDYDQHIREVREQIYGLTKMGYKNRSRSAVHKLLMWIGQIESVELRRQYEREIRSEFRSIMKGVPVEVKVGTKSKLGREGDGDNWSQE